MADVSKHIIPEIYSDVMFQLAEDTGLSDRVLDDLKSLAEVLREQSEFVSVLSDAKLSENEKVGTIRRVFAGKVCPLALNFLSVLARRGRLGFLQGIADRYEVLVNEKKHCKFIEVTVAKELNEGQMDKLRTELKQAVQSEIQLELNIDPGIVGGVIIRRGDTVVDNSVRTILNRAVQAVMERSQQKLDAPRRTEEA